MKKVGIIDCGISNLTSISNAFKYFSIPTEITHSTHSLESYSHLVLPGVGTFYQGMYNLREKGLDNAIKQRVAKGVPLLGICLGMQLIANKGSEFGITEGLGLIDGSVDKIQPVSHEFRLPHIGWNDVHFSQNTKLWEGIPEDTSFYFVHSYTFSKVSEENIIGYCDYGGKVVAAVAHENVYGIQFHAEKSQKYGLKLLENFVELC